MAILLLKGQRAIKFFFLPLVFLSVTWYIVLGLLFRCESPYLRKEYVHCFLAVLYGGETIML